MVVSIYILFSCAHGFPFLYILDNNYAMGFPEIFPTAHSERMGEEGVDDRAVKIFCVSMASCLLVNGCATAPGNRCT